MNEEKYILAIDHGTSGIKAALVSVYGEIIDFVFKSTPIYLKEKGGAEQNPDEWWEALIKTSQYLIDKQLIPIDNIVGVCCSSQWSGTVPVDKNGDYLKNAIIWMDSRGAPYVKKRLRGLIKVSGYPVQDIIRFVRKSGGAPSLSGKDPIAHILYLQYEEPDIYQHTQVFLEPKDYLNFKLTGKIAASFDSIMLHWVTNIQDINNIHYDKSLIRRLGVSKDKFPKLMQATDVLGTVRSEVADILGINNNVKVVMGSPDLQSAIIGSGAVQDYQGHIYIGTSSWIITHVPFKKTDIFHNIATLPSAIPGRYFTANEQESAGQCLNFLRDNIFYSDDEEYFGKQEVYQMFDRLAEQVAPGSENLIFAPWLYGERTPIDDHYVRGIIFNLSLNSKKEQIVRAAFEGVAYNSRWVLKYLEAFTKRKLDPLNIIGGGAQSDIWVQIYADVLNKRIKRIKDPLQANARGAAFIASVGLGYINFNQIPRLTQYSGEFSPIRENVKIYNQLFKEFLNLYKHNKKAFQKLNH
ncbi:MAG: xylulose kinase [Candidatus Heimdallarchaeota archaeon]|nr:xylulose kinase [Candidatus Heimdallarchaeota archaeon]